MYNIKYFEKRVKKTVKPLGGTNVAEVVPRQAQEALSGPAGGS